MNGLVTITARTDKYHMERIWVNAASRNKRTDALMVVYPYSAKPNWQALIGDYRISQDPSAIREAIRKAVDGSRRTLNEGADRKPCRSGFDHTL